MKWGLWVLVFGSIEKGVWCVQGGVYLESKGWERKEGGETSDMSESVGYKKYDKKSR